MTPPPHDAEMIPIPGPRGKLENNAPRTFRSGLPLAAAAVGAAGLGFVLTAAPLWSGAILFPHRLRALLAVLGTALLWTLCARLAPTLGRAQSKGRRSIRIAIFISGTICLLAALQTAKVAVAYLTGGFAILLSLSIFLTAHVFAIIRGRLDLYLLAVGGWSTILGALSIALLLGEWDPGSIIIAAGYGALCAAIALSSWQPPIDKRFLSLYPLTVLFGCMSLPAITIISGLPPRYLVTYLVLWPAVNHLRRISTAPILPAPWQPLKLALCYLGLLVAVSVISHQSAPPPVAIDIEAPVPPHQ